MPRRPRPMDLAAAGGVAGPVAFAAAWSVLGARTPGYSPVDDAISRLAALGSPEREAMTAGIVAFGAGVAAFGTALRARLPGPAWACATATGLAALGVAAFPLDEAGSGRTHGLFAAFAYASLAATPVAAAPLLARQGRRGPAAVSAAVGVTSGALLAATALGPASGLFQRAGLSLGHAWIVAAAVQLIRGNRSGHSSVPGRAP